jgi:hypothetical protein
VLAGSIGKINGRPAAEYLTGRIVAMEPIGPDVS